MNMLKRSCAIVCFAFLVFFFLLPSLYGEIKGVRYLRYWVFETRSLGYSYWNYVNFFDGNIIGDFRVIKNGVELSWPTGTVCTYDNIQGFAQYGQSDVCSTTAVIDGYDGCSARDANNFFTKGTFVKYAPRQQMCYKITLPESQSIDFEQYAIYRGYETRQFITSPRSWRMEVSANGTDWFPIDEVKNFNGDDWTCYGWYGVTPYPYYTNAVSSVLNLDLSSVGTATLMSGTVKYAVTPKAVSARNLRWTVNGIASGSRFVMNEFAVALGGVRLPRTAGATALGNATGAEYLFDGDTATKWDVIRDFENAGAIVAEIDLGKVTTFDGYDLCVDEYSGHEGEVTPNAYTLEAQDPETGLWHIIATEDSSSLGELLSKPQFVCWRSDYIWPSSPEINGQMFHLSVDALPEVLLRTAAAFDGVALSVAPGATVEFANTCAAFAPDTFVQGNLVLQNAVLKSIPGNALEQASVTGDGCLSYANGSVAVLPSVLDNGVRLTGDDGRLRLASDLTGKKPFKFVRIRVFELSNGINKYGGEEGRKFDVGELELLKDGVKVPWPAGTIAYRSDAGKTPASGLINAPMQMPSEDISDWKTNRFAEGIVNVENRDASKRAVWMLASSADIAEGPAYIVELGGPMEVDSFRVFNGFNTMGEYACLNKWHLDVSYDGEIWYTVDDVDLTGKWNGAYMDHTFIYKNAVNLFGVESQMVDRISDGTVLELASSATLTLLSVVETVGGLAGSGTVAFAEGTPALILKNATPAASFSGAVTGLGTLIVDGGQAAMRGANLTGISRIVVRNGGVLTGTATLRKDVEVVFESGGTMRINRGLVIVFQ